MLMFAIKRWFLSLAYQHFFSAAVLRSFIILIHSVRVCHGGQNCCLVKSSKLFLFSLSLSNTHTHTHSHTCSIPIFLNLSFSHSLFFSLCSSVIFINVFSLAFFVRMSFLSAFLATFWLWHQNSYKKRARKCWWNWHHVTYFPLLPKIRRKRIINKFPKKIENGPEALFMFHHAQQARHNRDKGPAKLENFCKGLI